MSKVTTAAAFIAFLASCSATPSPKPQPLEQSASTDEAPRAESTTTPPSPSEPGSTEDAPPPSGEVIIESANDVHCRWVGGRGNGWQLSDVVHDGETYAKRSTREKCDSVTVELPSSAGLQDGLRVHEEFVRVMGSERVSLELGKPVEVFRTLQDVADAANGGNKAAAVVPKGFDFETQAVVRYDVLHSRRVRCRDGMLGLPPDKAGEVQAAWEKWENKRKRLATRWRFIDDAAEKFGDVLVLDPILPDERGPAPDGPCTESWIAQPALTAVPRGAKVFLLTR